MGDLTFPFARNDFLSQSAHISLARQRFAETFVAMADVPVIDLQAIENLRSLNPGDNDEFLREIVGIFLEDTPQRIAELEQSLAANDTSKFTRAAHSIKGSSANLGASALRAVAETVEHLSRKEPLSTIAPLVESIKTEFAKAQTELSKLLRP